MYSNKEKISTIGMAPKPIGSVAGTKMNPMKNLKVSKSTNTAHIHSSSNAKYTGHSKAK